MAKLTLAVVAAALLVALVSAGDPEPMNDFCVADLTSALLFNGLECMSPARVKAEDFAFRGFRSPADTNNPLGFGIATGFAGKHYPALNTQSLALAKFDYAEGGVVPPHTHPRAAEVITVVSGQVYVGFVDTVGKLYAATLKTGDFFLFPAGLLHFQANSGSGHSVTVSVLNMQNPGMQVMTTALFGSEPAIATKILSKAFGITDEQTNIIRKGLTPPT